jgi:hypothetical protein
MRTMRSLALVFLALAVPLSRGAAQTCQGTAAFQDGRFRAGVDDQHNSDFNDVRGTIEFGIPKSFFGGLSVGESTVSGGGPSGAGFDANLGYQFHLSDTPFQICPLLTGHYDAIDGTTTTQVGFGGGMGYRFGINHWFTLVPAAGVVWTSTRVASQYVNLSTNPGGSNPSQSNTLTGNNVFMVMGLVFNNVFTINPGVRVPSYSGAKAIYTIGVSINWFDPSR